MYTEKELKDGFLDNELSLEVNRVRKESHEIYEILKKMNFLFYEIEKNYEKEKPTFFDIYIKTTFSQIHVSFQSYILLLERGLYDDSQIIMRSLYDKILSVLYALEDNNKFERLIQGWITEKIKTCNYIDAKNLYQFIDLEKLNTEKAELSRISKLNEKGKKIELPSNKDICEELNLQGVYVKYRLLSSYTHNSLNVVLNRLIEKEEGILINQNIDHGDFDFEIAKLVESMEYIIKPICGYLNLNNISEEFNKLCDMLIEILKKKR